MKRLAVLIMCHNTNMPTRSGRGKRNSNLRPTAVEGVLYGEPGSGSLVERIERVETDVFGGTQPGAAMLRIDRLNTFLQIRKLRAEA